MRIMHISTRLILGGSQENTVLSCEGQADRGHDVSLVFGPIYGPEGSMLERVQRHGGIETIETPRLVRQIAPIKDMRSTRDLRKIIRAWKPDVVHTHSSKAGILGRIAAWKELTPCVVHTIHGLPFHPYLAKWRNWMYIKSERFAAKRCHRIICVAEAMKTQALAAKIGQPAQYEVVYSGMESKAFANPDVSREQARSELGLAENDFVLGTVSRLAELKGHDDLLDALGDLMKQRPELKLLWVGDGWWRDRLMSRVAQLGLTDQVITTGLVPPETIPKHLQAMDALAHPSYREGLPRAVTQALLSATPVIVYDVDGGREVCIDGRTGRLIAPGDLHALRESTVWMMDHPEERAAYGRNGQAMCLERFDASTMVEHLERVYESVLAHTTNARGDHDDQLAGDRTDRRAGNRPGS